MFFKNHLSYTKIEVNLIVGMSPLRVFLLISHEYKQPYDKKSVKNFRKFL
jgi:hypothetical protein